MRCVLIESQHRCDGQSLRPHSGNAQTPNTRPKNQDETRRSKTQPGSRRWVTRRPLHAPRLPASSKGPPSFREALTRINHRTPSQTSAPPRPRASMTEVTCQHGQRRNQRQISDAPASNSRRGWSAVLPSAASGITTHFNSSHHGPPVIAAHMKRWPRSNLKPHVQDMPRILRHPPSSLDAM